MKAEIAELNGKYYGTEIFIYDNGKETGVTVWYMGDYSPSDRQLSNWGYTREQFDKNEPEYEEYNGDPKGYASYPRDMLCDSHYETRDGYNLARIICDAINKEGGDA